MAQSLKKRYNAKKLQMLQEHVKAANAQLLKEEAAARLIVEVMSQEDLEKVSTIVQKMESIKSPQLPVLSKAIEQATTELNKYTGGGMLTKAWAKLKSLVGIDNPVVKVMTFADALERGFSQIPLILKNNLGNVKNIDTSKSLSTLLAEPQKTGSTKELPKDKEEPFTDDPVGSKWPGPASQNEADNVKVSGKLKIVADQMLKALTPAGIFGAFKKIPYIDTKALVQELVTAPINAIAPAIKKMQSGAKAADVANDMKGAVQGTGDAETKGAQPGQPPSGTTGGTAGAPTRSADATTPSQPGEQKPQSPGMQMAQQKAQARAKKLYDNIKNDFESEGVDEATAMKVMTILAYNEKLRG